MLRLTERDTSAIGLAPTLWFDVTVTETLEQIVRIEAHSPEEAEQLIARDWVKGSLSLTLKVLLVWNLWLCLLKMSRTRVHSIHLGIPQRHIENVYNRVGSGFLAICHFRNRPCCSSLTVNQRQAIFFEGWDIRCDDFPGDFSIHGAVFMSHDFRMALICRRGIVGCLVRKSSDRLPTNSPICRIHSAAAFR